MIERSFRLNTFGFGNQNVRMSKLVVGLAEIHTEIDRMKSIWNPRSHLAVTLVPELRLVFLLVLMVPWGPR